jgi:hypothetical protein
MQIVALTSMAHEILFRILLRHSGRGPSDDVVDCRLFANIYDAVQVAARDEQYRSRADALRLAIDLRFDGAVLYDHELFFRLRNRRMCGVAGIDRGDVALELVKHGRAAIEELTLRSILRGFVFRFIELKDGRLKHGLRGRLRPCHSGQRCQRNGGDDQFSASKHRRKPLGLS